MKAAAAGKFNQQASIHDLVTQSGLSREKVHKALLREAQAGNISLHGSTIAEARYPEAEQKNWLRVPGEPQPFASFAIRPKAAAPAGASPAGTSPGGPGPPAGTSPGGPGPPAGAPPIPPRGPGPPAGGLPLPPRAGPPPTPRPAAAPPAAPKDFIRDVADELHALGGHSVASEREMLTYLQGMQREFPVISSPKAQEAMYRRFERGGLGALSPEEQVVWNKYIAPLKQREQAAYVSAKQGLGKTVDISDLDPNYMHRQAADHTPAFTIGGAHPDPVFGVRGGGGLPKQAVSMRSPKYVALDPVDPKDRFKLVQDIGEGQAIEWENNKKTVRAIDDGKLKPGEAVEIGGKDYTVRRAISDEVEQNTPTRYVLNAAYNTAVNTLKLEAIDRNIATLNRLKQTGAQWMTRSPATAPKGWIETKLPQLKGYVMDPRLAHTIDDFYSPGFGSDHWIEVLRRTNHAIAGTMFWNPTPHALNVMGHWYVSRGWQWATPQGYWRLMRDGFKAVKEVTTQGPLYRDLLRNSSSMFFGGVMNREFETLLARKMGMEIARDPARWGPVMKRLGWPVNRAADFGALMYEGSRRAMWWANDIFMMQRVMELKRRGLTTVEAIREAEKHIPNYRVPPEVLGSRLLSVAMQDPLLTIFNRYHYGAMKSWASMVNDLVRGKTGKERWDAVGQWMAAGLAAFVIYPVLDQAVRKVTGNEAATVRRRGPFSYSAAAMGGVQNMFEDYLPEAANENLKAATGDTKGFSDLLASMLIPSPLITQAVEASTGRETWSGRLIAEPKGTSLERGVQIGDHLLQGLLAPYGTVSRAAGSEQPAQALPAEVLGWKLPSEASQAYKPKQERRDIRSVARRKTRGVLERGLQAIREYGGTTE
jgi:hypothetical protein